MIDFNQLEQKNTGAFIDAAYYFAIDRIDDTIAALELQIELAKRELEGEKKTIFDYSNDFEMFLFAPSKEIEELKTKEVKPVQIKLCPLYNLLATAYLKRKYYNDAKAAAIESIALDPLSAEPYLILARIDLETHNYHAALETLSIVKSVAYSLGDVCAYYHCWGHYFHLKKQIPEAIVAYETALNYDIQPEQTAQILTKIIDEASCQSDPAYFTSANLSLYDIAKDPMEFDAVRIAYLAAQQALKDNEKILALFLLRVSNTIIQRDDIGDYIHDLYEEIKKQEEEQSPQD